MNHGDTPIDHLARVRGVMRDLGLDALIVRGTDRYLNEYVPHAESTREWLTGFTGSMGDALVTADGAFLFVDGRYHTQADREVDLARWTVVKNALGTTNEAACATRLEELTRGREAAPWTVGYESDRYAVTTFEAFTKSLGDAPVVLRPLSPSPLEAVRGAVPPVVQGAGRVRAVDESRMGRDVAQKLTLVRDWLRDKGARGLLVSKLDEVAWLTNLRAEEMPFQATFRGRALVTEDALLLAVHASLVGDEVRDARPLVRWVDDAAIFDAVRALGAGAKVALDPASTPVAVRDAVTSAGAKVKAVASPIVAAKAKKTPAELSAMREALGAADHVVARAQAWLRGAVCEGRRVTEADFAREVERLFREAGAVGLSFKVIAAAGVNGAVVHHPASEEAVIERGQVMLLDTGCYFADGFATDLTRTFFVGGPDDVPTPEQRRLFTLTLKSAIAGMTARVPKGAVGAQIDGITRAPLWAAGLDYLHGTGHGVGINVHESPPGIAKTSQLSLDEGHVFSIEPGVYLEGVGGVRIENLCTVVADGERAGFWRVIPLTFSPLDERLIEPALLDEREREFLRGYADGFAAVRTSGD
jgi:Xaa-Pro aminopeptidase